MFRSFGIRRLKHDTHVRSSLLLDDNHNSKYSERAGRHDTAKYSKAGMMP